MNDDTNILIFECSKCKSQWLEEFKLPMDVNKFVNAMGYAEKCPKCGKQKGAFVLLGERFHEAYKRLKEEHG